MLKERAENRESAFCLKMADIFYRKEFSLLNEFKVISVLYLKEEFLVPVKKRSVHLNLAHVARKQCLVQHTLQRRNLIFICNRCQTLNLFLFYFLHRLQQWKKAEYVRRRVYVAKLFVCLFVGDWFIFVVARNVA